MPMIRNIEVLMAQAMSRCKRPPLVLPYSLGDAVEFGMENDAAWPKYLHLPQDTGFWDLRIHCADEAPANENAA